MSEQVQQPTEEELLNLGLGIVPAIQTYVQPEMQPIEMIDGSLMNYMHDHIHRWLSEDVYKRTINLPQDKKDRYFKMITEYGDIISEILNDDNNVIYEYAKGNPNPWVALEAHAEKSNMVIDYEKPAQLIKEYQEWRQRNGL